MKEFLHAKLHNVRITETNKEYEGSITIDKRWLRASRIKPYEKVIVADVENGARFTTYVIEGEEGSGIIGINGSAANLVNKWDRVIIMAFKHLSDKDIEGHQVSKVIFNDSNEIKETVVESPFSSIFSNM